MLHLTLFGTPTIVIEQNTLKLTSLKARALLFYLALQAQPVSRQQLVGLLWPEVSEAAARRSLRVLLSKIRPKFAPYLHITRREISLRQDNPLVCDVHDFVTELGAGQVEAALALYQGELLHGFQLIDSAEFDLWLLAERERLRQLYVGALHQRLSTQLTQAQWADSEATARQLTLVDSWDEVAYRGLIVALARQGERAMALAEYERCRRLLAQELAVEPTAETLHLIEQVRQGEFSASDIASTLQPPHNLPLATTPFIGRKHEIGQIINQLTQPTTRLLTLLGAGGMGKTRLAAEAAQHFVSIDVATYPEGVYFVALEVVREQPHAQAQIVQAIAHAIGLNLTPNGDRLAQIGRLLQQRRLLLVIDNFEQLVATAADLLQFLIDKTRYLTLLVTSRQRLRLPAEQVLPLHGLPIKAADSAQTALHLFEIRAQRHDLGFQPVPQLAAITQICQLVEGLPLAIELAAAWVHLLSCQQIYTLIANNLAEISDSSLPSRHRSMQAVFAQSWALLSEQERNTLANLTVFRGGFSAEAATTIAKCDLSVLFSLIEKSLIQRPTLQRYGLHTLLQQLLAEREHSAHVARTHQHYYLNWISHHASTIQRGDDPEIYPKILLESDNLRVAIEHALLTQDRQFLEAAINPCMDFWLIQGWLHEGQQLCERLAVVFDAGIIFGRIQFAHAIFHSRLGEFQTALTILEQALPALDQPTTQHEFGLAKAKCGVFLFRLGESAQANQQIAASVALFEAQDDQHGRAKALAIRYLISSRLDDEVAFDYLVEALSVLTAPRDRARPLGYFGAQMIGEGRYTEATAAFEESIALLRSFGEMAGVASGLVNLSIAAGRAGQYAKAEQMALQALGLFEQSDARGGMAVCYFSLGEATRFAGGLESAEKFYQQSNTLHRANNNTYGELITDHGLACIALARDKPDALDQFSSLLQQCQAGGFASMLGNILCDAAGVLAKQGGLLETVGLLTFCLNTQADELIVEAYMLQQAQQLLDELQAEVESNLFVEGVDFGRKLTTDQAVALVVNWGK